MEADTQACFITGLSLSFRRSMKPWRANPWSFARRLWRGISPLIYQNGRFGLPKPSVVRLQSHRARERGMGAGSRLGGHHEAHSEHQGDQVAGPGEHEHRPPRHVGARRVVVHARVPSMASRYNLREPATELFI